MAKEAEEDAVNVVVSKIVTYKDLTGCSIYRLESKSYFVPPTIYKVKLSVCTKGEAKANLSLGK